MAGDKARVPDNSRNVNKRYRDEEQASIPTYFEQENTHYIAPASRAC